MRSPGQHQGNRKVLQTSTLELWRAVRNAGPDGAPLNVLRQATSYVFDEEQVRERLKSLRNGGYVVCEPPTRAGRYYVTTRAPKGETAPEWGKPSLVPDPVEHDEEEDQGATPDPHVRRGSVLDVKQTTVPAAQTKAEIQGPPSVFHLGGMVMAGVKPAIVAEPQREEFKPAAQVPVDAADAFRCALDSNGVLQIEADGQQLTLPLAHTRRLLHYLDNLLGATRPAEGAPA